MISHFVSGPHFVSLFLCGWTRAFPPVALVSTCCVNSHRACFHMRGGAWIRKKTSCMGGQEADFLFVSVFPCAFVFIGTRVGWGNVAVGGYAHRVLPIVVFLGQLSWLLLFPGAAALASSSLFRPTAGWPLLGREFALGDTPVSCLFRVTNGSSSRKGFCLLISLISTHTG